MGFEPSTMAASTRTMTRTLATQAIGAKIIEPIQWLISYLSKREIF